MYINCWLTPRRRPLSPLLGYFISSLRFIWPCISPADPACPALPPLTGEKLQRSVSDRKR